MFSGKTDISSTDSGFQVIPSSGFDTCQVSEFLLNTMKKPSPLSTRATGPLMNDVEGSAKEGQWLSACRRTDSPRLRLRFLLEWPRKSQAGNRFRHCPGWPNSHH